MCRAHLSPGCHLTWHDSPVSKTRDGNPHESTGHQPHSPVSGEALPASSSSPASLLAWLSVPVWRDRESEDSIGDRPVISGPVSIICRLENISMIVDKLFIDSPKQIFWIKFFCLNTISGIQRSLCFWCDKQMRLIEITTYQWMSEEKKKKSCEKKIKASDPKLILSTVFLCLTIDLIPIRSYLIKKKIRLRCKILVPFLYV